ncbi:MAG: NADH-quinone oxidoreductase subunit J [Candidatus Gastranaerophilales bacterium]|nr:NADH-quinone oxidoreductase subunit J [Candidatus Gastranaerophilales bacterium]
MELLSHILFYIVASLLVVSALGVVFAPRIIYSLVSAFVAFMLVAFVFFMLNAPFNAAVQISVYGVAVAILFAFAIMMTSYNKEKNLYVALAPRTVLAAIGLFMIVGALITFVVEDYSLDYGFSFMNVEVKALFDTTLEIAKGLFTNYIFCFELLSVFLLIAIVGVGAIITFKKSEDS